MTHHDRLIGHLAHHSQVVGDEKHGHFTLLLQLQQQFHDLALHGHVQCRGRLVGDQQTRPAGQRHGDHDPLLLSARQLMRIGAQALAGIGNTDFAQQRFGALFGLAAAQIQMLGQHFRDLEADGEHRIERDHRILENHADLATTDFAPLTRCEAMQLPAFEFDRGLRAVDHVRPIEQPHDRQRRDRFAAAGLADQRHGGASRHIKRHILHRVTGAPCPGTKTHIQMAHAQQRPGLRFIHSKLLAERCADRGHPAGHR